MKRLVGGFRLEGASRSRILVQVVVIAVVLGLLSIGIAQKVIVVTTTTVITLPETTKVTTITKPGTTGVMTIVQGGYRLIHIEKRPDQECVIVIEAEPKSVVTIPGASFPGTTAVYTIPKTVYEVTLTRVEGGTTLVTTGVDYVTVETTISVGPVSTVMAVPVPVYGEFREYCQRITVTIIDRFEVNAPMTQKIIFPGFTFEGTVVTMPTLFITNPVTATKTTTRPGTTYTTTIEEAGTTVVKTVKRPGTVITKTITLPAKTVTKKVVYTTTLSESKPPEETVKPTPTKPPKPTKPKPTKPHITTATTTAAGVEFGGLFTLMLVAAAIVVAAVIAVVVVLVTRRPKAPGT